MKLLIIGAGLTGATIARCALDAGVPVTVLERAGHVGGNCRDYQDKHGHWVHEFGMHIFHTSNRDIHNFFCRFTSPVFYQHRVWAEFGPRGERAPLPFSMLTRAALGLSGDWPENVGPPMSGETFVQYARRKLGPEVSEKLVEGYSRKQWGPFLEAIRPSVLERLPLSSEPEHTNYFHDTFTYLPDKGYSSAIEKMLHGATIFCDVGLPEVQRHAFNANQRGELIVWTAPIDQLPLNFKGRTKLAWRGLSWVKADVPGGSQTPDRVAQPVLNLCHSDWGSAIRLYNWQQLPTGNQNAVQTTITLERAGGSHPCYPIPSVAESQLAHEYKQLAETQMPNVVLAGRLARYQYLDMHQAIGQGLAAWRNEIEPKLLCPSK